jgi:hypothetical protein
MPQVGSFEILINGIPRTYRDIEALAVQSARFLKHREKGSEVTIIDRNTRKWAVVRDLVSEPLWQEPGVAAAKPL